MCLFHYVILMMAYRENIYESCESLQFTWMLLDKQNVGFYGSTQKIKGP